MCKSQAEGGQRCAAYTRAKYAMTSLDDPTWETVAAEYASTQEGRERLAEEAHTARYNRQYDLEARLLRARHRGESMREANKAAAHAIRQQRPVPQSTGAADVAATTDDAALAADYMIWQGDGPEPTTSVDEEGWDVDEYGNQWGMCNDCGLEQPKDSACCPDGEIVPRNQVF